MNSQIELALSLTAIYFDGKSGGLIKSPQKIWEVFSYFYNEIKDKEK